MLKNFEKFEAIIDKYLPDYDQGDTLATQAVTAATKLVYKWFNDGDVYDNRYALKGWANDLSSYANWLYRYVDAEILLDIAKCQNEEDYEKLLFELCEQVFDEYCLDEANEIEAEGDVYECEGPFSFERDYY